MCWASSRSGAGSNPLLLNPCVDPAKALTLLAILELLLNRTIPRLGFLATTKAQYVFFEAVKYAGLLSLSALLVASAYVAARYSPRLGAALIAGLAVDYAAYVAGYSLPALPLVAALGAAVAAKQAPHLAAALALYAFRGLAHPGGSLAPALDLAWALIPLPLISRDAKRLVIGAALSLALFAAVASSPYPRLILTFAMGATLMDSVPIAAFAYVASRGGPWRLAPLIVGPAATLSSSYAYLVASAALASRASPSETGSRP